MNGLNKTFDEKDMIDIIVVTCITRRLSNSAMYVSPMDIRVLSPEGQLLNLDCTYKVSPSHLFACCSTHKGHTMAIEEMEMEVKWKGKYAAWVRQRVCRAALLTT